MLSELFEIIYLLSHLKDHSYKGKKKWNYGERETILGESSDCDEMHISNWLMVKFFQLHSKQQANNL